nr:MULTISPECIES: hypothetical protein [unclassified Chelatococcus]
MSSKGNELARGERLQIMLDADELRALDDFRFAERMPSRAAAVRELLRRGLAMQEGLTGHDGAQSRSFGVLSTAPIEPTREDGNSAE